MNSAKSITWLHRFAWFTSIATLFLICSGGMVTSKGVGLAVPDWPTTFGYNMFLFPVSQWVGGIFFEHTHRLIASTVGLLTIVLAVWIWRADRRRWMRNLGFAALGAVILQGVLGGLRVTLLKDEIGIFHACLAQAFLGMLIVITLATSRLWERLVERARCAVREPDETPAGNSRTPRRGVPTRSLARVVICTTLVIYLQLGLGATMRHQHRDLSILDFPFAYGKIIPDTSVPMLAKINAWRDARALSDVTPFHIWLQLTHRFVALMIASGVIVSLFLARRTGSEAGMLSRFTDGWFLLLACQITLGAWVIWSNKAADIATAHVAVGATMFALGISLGHLPAAPAGSGTVGISSPSARFDGDSRLMKSAALAAEIDPAIPVPERRSFMSDFSELVKARLTLLVLVTTAVGYYLGAAGPINWLGLFHAVFGTALAAAGAAALNQWWERRLDALMHRTRSRPIPAGRMLARDALILGCLLSIGGVVYLTVCCNWLSALLAAATIGIYIFAYTPLKRVSTFNTLIGAIPGALPPVVGWAAANGRVDVGAWSLFAILFFWQMPHFFAIAWMYREDYARAGFEMISKDDKTGARSASQAVLFCILLLFICGGPAFLRIVNYNYLTVELVLNGLFILAAMRFLRTQQAIDARRLFLTSIAYLPLLLGALVLTKI